MQRVKATENAMSTMSRACGTWSSPISPEEVARAALRLGNPTVADDGSLFWLEGRPAENGRSVLVHRLSDGSVVDVTPPPYNVRSSVHEYGGGAFAVASADQQVFFVNFADQAVYRQRDGEAPVRLTSVSDQADPSSPAWRFADLVVDPARPRVLAVAERHDPGRAEAENMVVAIDRESGAIEILVRGADFYASPTPNLQGTRLAWLSWNHPHMPWDAAALHVADLDTQGRPGPARHLAGDAEASAQQPAFGPDGALWFLYERSGFWNLWRETNDGVKPLFQIDAELGLPLWQLGASSWGFFDERTVLVAAQEKGTGRLYAWDTRDGQLRPVPVGVTSVIHLSVRTGRAALLAGFSDSPPAIVEIDEHHRAERAGAPGLRANPGTGLRVAARAALLPDQRGRHGLRILLSPAKPGGSAPAPGEASPSPSRPRRSDRGERSGAEHQRPVLDYPRICGARPQLPRKHRLRQALPRPAERQLGHLRR